MKVSYVIAIDPGTTESGVCIVNAEDYRPLWQAKLPNDKLLGDALSAMYTIDWEVPTKKVQIVIERMQGNGAPVSSTVFITCEWIGRFDVFFQTVYKGNTKYFFRRN